MHGGREDVAALPLLSLPRFLSARAATGRQRVRPARLAEAPDQHFVGGIEEDQHRVQVPHLLQLAEDLGDLVEHLAFADVDNDGGARDFVASWRLRANTGKRRS